MSRQLRMTERKTSDHELGRNAQKHAAQLPRARIAATKSIPLSALGSPHGFGSRELLVEQIADPTPGQFTNTVVAQDRFDPAMLGHRHHIANGNIATTGFGDKTGP